VRLGKTMAALADLRQSVDVFFGKLAVEHEAA